MFERFTDSARRVLVLAQEEARRLNHSMVGTEHLLLGLIHLGESGTVNVFETLGITLERARRQVLEYVSEGPSAITGAPPFTPRTKKVLELALREALQLGHTTIGPEHILLGLVREGEGVGATALVGMGVRLSEVSNLVILSLGTAVDDRGALAAVDGTLVEKVDIPVGAATLFAWDDAATLLLAGPLLADARIERTKLHGLVYETCTYRPRLPPEISVSVAGAVVGREAFDEYTNRFLSDAENIDGLGDAATYSASKRALRVLTGSTLFVVKVRGHPDPKAASVAAARRALANLRTSQA